MTFICVYRVDHGGERLYQYQFMTGGRLSFVLGASWRWGKVLARKLPRRDPGKLHQSMGTAKHQMYSIPHDDESSAAAGIIINPVVRHNGKHVGCLNW